MSSGLDYKNFVSNIFLVLGSVLMYKQKFGTGMLYCLKLESLCVNLRIVQRIRKDLDVSNGD